MDAEGFGEGWAGVLAGAREGADWAWERIYDSLAPTILGYLRARGAPDPDAVSGEVFCQLVRDIKRFSGDEAGFRSWVFVMVHHRLLDDLRRRKRRPEISTEAEEFGAVRDATDVESAVVDRDTERELRDAMEVLTEPQRDVLLLRVFGGLKIEEIAEAMGRRVGAVKALQRRGLETLREEVERRGLLRNPDDAEYPIAPEERLPHI